MSNPNFQYSGNHEKHPPDLKVLSRIIELLAFFEAYKITARTKYFDEQNMYHITFVRNAHAFLSLYHTVGSGICDMDVGDDGRIQISKYFFVHNGVDELRKEIRYQLAIALEKEIDVTRN